MPSLNEIRSLIETNEIHTVEVGFADIQGVLRGKRISARFFLKNLEKGFALSKAVFVWDIACAVFEGMEFANFDNGYPDMVARPILETFRPVPWRPGSAIVLCDLYDEEGHPIEAAPRQVLKVITQRVRELGYTPMIGSELEFYLLDQNKDFLYNGIQCYSIGKGSELEPVLSEIRLSLERMGILIEACNTEYGPGQVEVNLEYGEAVDMADKTLLFKHAVKEIARRHNMRATFMAKPWPEESGNGFHVHQSYWDSKRERNMFAEDQGLALKCLAGLLTHIRDFMAFGSPTINSYKRQRPYSFAPYNATWGYDNRTVAIRSFLTAGKGSRLEHRTGSADANPYLAIAACIAAGLDGIENDMQPPPCVEGDAYATDAPILPVTLDQALDRLAKSETAVNYFGKQFMDIFLKIGWHEVELFRGVVTDWEWNRYWEVT